MSVATVVGPSLESVGPRLLADATGTPTPRPTPRPTPTERLGVCRADVDAALDGLAGAAVHAQGWLETNRRDVLADLDRWIATLTATRGQVLLAEQRAGEWRGSGDKSFEAWRSRTARTGEWSATAQVGQAHVLEDLPSIGEAVTGGRVALEHVDTIARLAASVAPQVREAMTSGRRQGELLAMAESEDAATFARSAARWVAGLDPESLERDHEAQRRARFLHVVDTPSGTRIKGLVDTMAGHRLRLALEACSPRPAADDDRSSEQRRADALTALADRALAAPDTTPGASVRPHVSFVMSQDAWTRLRSARARVERSSTARVERSSTALASAGEPHDARPVTLEDGTPVPVVEVAQALCDCELTRVVVDAEGAPVNLGRAQRLYSGPQRRAVIVRDRECSWPSCTAQARWCEIHHMRWWDRDLGPTSVENGVLLCSFHHHEVHRRDLSITRCVPEASARSRSTVGDGSGLSIRHASQATSRGEQVIGGAEQPAGRVSLAAGIVGSLAGHAGSSAGHGSDPPDDVRSTGHPRGGLGARYEFRDRAGRLVAPVVARDVSPPAAAPVRGQSPPVSVPDLLEVSRVLEIAPVSEAAPVEEVAPESRSRRRSASADRVLPLEPCVDSVTGTSAPLFVLE